MMKITYGEGWFRAHKRLTNVGTERARQAHENRQLYAALLDPSTEGGVVVEANQGYIGVEFLDGLQRARQSLTFQEFAPGRLFLSRVVFRHFDGLSDTVAGGTTWYFKADGS